MKNFAFSYVNHANDIPKSKTIYRELSSKSRNTGIQKDKYKLCMKVLGDLDIALFLTCTSKNYTNSFGTYCCLTQDDFTDIIDKNILGNSYIYFSKNNEVWEHLLHDLFKRHLQQGKLIIAGTINNTKYVELENIVRKSTVAQNNLKNHCTLYISELTSSRNLSNSKAPLAEYIVGKFL